jgi:hypothetical protein
VAVRGAALEDVGVGEEVDTASIVAELHGSN